MGFESMSLSEVFAGLVVGILAIAFGWQKFYNGWKSGEAESSVITIMHEELERMGKQNTLLATELNKLQVEIVTLNRELYKLNLENQRLHTEVVALTTEVSRLQTLLNAGGQDVSSTD
jgi:chromosome segregation ATPase